jgi:hypothetical protein
MTTSTIGRVLRGSKDAALALAVRGFFNAKFSKIGEMTELLVDTKKRAFRLRLDLAGEAEPIEIHVKKYSLERRGERATLTIVDANASREWLTQVLREFVVGQKFTIPDRAATVLKLLA